MSARSTLWPRPAPLSSPKSLPFPLLGSAALHSFFRFWEVTLPFYFSAVSPLLSIIHIAMWINSTQCIPGDPLPLSLSLETSLYLCPFLTSPPSPVKSSLQTTSKPHQRICISNSPPESTLTFLLHTPLLAWPTVSLSWWRHQIKRWGHQGGDGTLSGLPS